MSNYRYVIKGKPEKPLSNEKTCEYIDKYNEGDETAVQPILIGHSGLVIKIATEDFGFLYDTEDVISNGMIGLHEAIKHFDTSFGSRFSTFAGPWIKCYIYKFMSTTRTISMPQAAARKMAALKRHLLLFTEETRPSIKELKQYLEENGYGTTSEKMVRILLMMMKEMIYIDGPIEHDDNYDYHKFLTKSDTFPIPGTELEKEDLHKHTAKVISELSEREQIILHMRFVENKTLELTSKVIGRTRERVRQIQNAALAKCRNKISM